MVPVCVGGGGPPLTAEAIDEALQEARAHLEGVAESSGGEVRAGHLAPVIKQLQEQW